MYLREGGRHLTVNYTGSQSIIITPRYVIHRLENLMRVFILDWVVQTSSLQTFPFFIKITIKYRHVTCRI